MKSNDCKLIREALKHQAEYCLMPFTCNGEKTQICSIVDYRGNFFDLRFFDEKYNVKFFVYHDIEKQCWHAGSIEERLLTYSKEAALLFLHSLFCKMTRSFRAAAAAAARSRYAAAAAADADARYAADAADAAARSRYAAADAADAAADAADAADAAAAAAAARSRYAAAAAARYAADADAAAAARYADAADAADAAAAADARYAFKAFVKYRKLQSKRIREDKKRAI